MPPSLSLTGKRWYFSRTALKQRSVHELIALLCREREINPREQRALTPTSVFPDITRAVERIQGAIAKGERVGIFGDYDCDGVTAVAQLVRFFRRHGVEPSVRLPHRMRDGYGLSASIVDDIRTAKTQLLITADTGISSIKEITTLQEQGIDVIVTDHHHLQAELPPAHALVHPALAPGHPLPHPSGAGVVFALLRALEQQEWEEMAVDRALAMIGTVADLVELKGDNRTLVQQGLAALTQIKDGPLALLSEQVQSNQQPLTSTDIAFRIAPRINAAGRMADPLIALEALLEGGEALTELHKLNTERQDQVQELMKGVLDTIDPSDVPPLLCIASMEYPPGVIGLIAGRLTEMFGRPSLVANITGETCTASLRSPSVYHITEGLTKCSDLLQSFGGHAQAAGCTFRMSALEELQTRLNEDICAQVDASLLLPTIIIDAEISPSDVTLDFCSRLSLLEPYGQGNPEPRFLIKNVIIQQPRLIGKEKTHLQGRIVGIKMIGFNLGDLYQQTSESLDIVCRIGIDTWQGMKRPQIFIEDFCIHAPDRSPAFVTD